MILSIFDTTTFFHILSFNFGDNPAHNFGRVWNADTDKTGFIVGLSQSFVLKQGEKKEKNIFSWVFEGIKWVTQILNFAYQLKGNCYSYYDFKPCGYLEK